LHFFCFFGGIDRFLRAPYIAAMTTICTRNARPRRRIDTARGRFRV
jgi:hypothetical protein